MSCLTKRLHYFGRFGRGSVASRGRIIRRPLSAMNGRFMWHRCDSPTIMSDSASGSGRRRPESFTLRACEPARMLLPARGMPHPRHVDLTPMLETRRDAIEGAQVGVPCFSSRYVTRPYRQVV